MISKIFIVHSSEILRAGLEAFVKNFFNGEISTFPKIDFSEIEVKKDEQIVLFCEAACAGKLAEKKSLNLKTIVVTLNKENTKIEGFDYSISVYSSMDEIKKVLEEINILQSSHTQNEGEELTLREREVLKLVACGFSNKMIAEKLFISIHTVISHRKNITEKIGIKSISGLTVYTILNNLIDTSEINPEDLI